MKLRQRLVPWFLSFCLCGCVALPDVAPNVCGNGVVEPESGEECDGYADSDKGQRCRSPEAKEGGACHFDCSPDATAPNGRQWECPERTSCGLDKLCREGSDTYESWVEFLPQQAHALQLGDLDGDGRADLLALGKPSSQWQSVPTVVFFDEKGTPQGQPFSLPTGIRSPVLAPIVTTGEVPRQQLVASTSFGIATLMANTKGEFFSLPYPSQTLPGDSTYRMVRVYGVTDTPMKEAVIIYLSSDGENVLSDGATNEPLGTFEHSVADLSAPPVAGNLDDREISPCDELVLAYKNSGDVYLHRFCDSGGHWLYSPELPQRVASLPAGHTATRGILLARVDDDEHLDLVLADNLGCPYVSFGLGDGTFVANRAYPTLTAEQMWPVLTPSLPCPGNYPLAIADMNEDGWPDWVLPKGIALASPLGFAFADASVRLDTYPSNGPSGETWTIARVAELTGDDHLDLIAGSSELADLDFFVGTGRDSLNPTVVQTDGPVKDMVTGDYDGDLINDVAFIQARIVTVSDPNTPPNGLAIAYGRRDGAPNSPTDIAGFASVGQLLSANYQTRDAIEEIGVLTETAAPAETQLTLFVGNLGRFPVSSLGLWKVVAESQPPGSPAMTTTVRGSPIASTSGRFVDSGNWSLLALAKDDCYSGSCPTRYRLWLAPNAKGSATDAPSDVISAPEFIPQRKDGELSVHFVVGALDSGDVASNKGLDNALMLTAGPDENQVSLWRVTLPLSASPLTWLSACPGRLTPASSPMLVDLNADHFLDLVLLLADPDPTVERLRLAIVWNSEDNHSLDLGQAEFVDRIFPSTVRGLAPNGSQGLFVATERGTYRVGWDKKLTSTALTFHDPSIGLPGGGAIAVGDMTGDGLADLALTVAGGISIFAQEQTKPEEQAKP